MKGPKGLGSKKPARWRASSHSDGGLANQVVQEPPALPGREAHENGQPECKAPARAAASPSARVHGFDGGTDEHGAEMAPGEFVLAECAQFFLGVEGAGVVQHGWFLLRVHIGT